MKKCFFYILFLLPLYGHAQSETTSSLEQAYPNANMKHVYGSVVRSVVKMVPNERLMKLVRHIELVVYGRFDLDSVPQARVQFEKMKRSLRQEDFEALLSQQGLGGLARLQQALSDVGLYAKIDETDVSALVLFRRNDKQLEFLDLSGEIRFSDFSAADVSAIFQLFETVRGGNLLNRLGADNDS